MAFLVDDGDHGEPLQESGEHHLIGRQQNDRLSSLDCGELERIDGSLRNFDVLVALHMLELLVKAVCAQPLDRNGDGRRPLGCCMFNPLIDRVEPRSSCHATLVEVSMVLSGLNQVLTLFHKQVRLAIRPTSFRCGLHRDGYYKSRAFGALGSSAEFRQELRV